MKNRKHLLILLVAFLLGIFLWIYTDEPPYSEPAQEFNIYWNFALNIAYQWKALHITFWNPEIAGGIGLYSCGTYPILSPYNVMAWVLNPEHFYRSQLIVPYMIGFFFAALFLFEVFGISLVLSIFGGLLYTGAIVGRQDAILESPFYLWGNAIFPLMLYCYYRLREKSFYLQIACIGSFIALQFALEGVFVYCQIVLWASYFVLAHLLLNLKNIPFFRLAKQHIIAMAILLFMAVGLWGIQMMPSIFYITHEGVREPQHYVIGSFSIFRLNDHRSVVTALSNSLFNRPMGASAPPILSLMFLCAALWLSNPKEAFQGIKNKFLFVHYSLTALLYFGFLHIIELLAKVIPILNVIFSPFTKFNLAHGLHTLDLYVTLVLAVILNNERLRLTHIANASPLRKILVWTFFVLSVAYGLLNISMQIPSLQEFFLSQYKGFKGLIFDSKSVYLIYAVLYIALIMFAFRLKNKIFFYIFAFSFPFLGFLNTVTSFNYNTKGKRIDPTKYLYETPEHEYYRNAKGKYFVPYEAPPSMKEDYNLHYGVHGTNGRLSLPSRRYRDFLIQYHNDVYLDSYISCCQISDIIKPSEALTTYFPVDFTTTLKNDPLPWKSFKKVVEGEKYDVWVRRSETQEVLFGNEIKVKSLTDVIHSFDVPYAQTILVEENDALVHNIKDTLLPKNKTIPQYENFTFTKQNHIRFSVKTSSETFVVVPQLFQDGWQVFVDGQSVDIFPAQHLFVAFKVPAGEHSVEMKFVPPWFKLGVIVNILAIALLVYLGLNARTQSRSRK